MLTTLMELEFIKKFQFKNLLSWKNTYRHTWPVLKYMALILICCSRFLLFIGGKIELDSITGLTGDHKLQDSQGTGRCTPASYHWKACLLQTLRLRLSRSQGTVIPTAVTTHISLWWPWKLVLEWSGACGAAAFTLIAVYNRHSRI